jgi:nucleotide-binding universal stress UspA family protein
MRRSIVCGVDNTDDSRAVLAVAAALAKQLEHRLVLVHVTPLGHPADLAIGAGAVTPETMLPDSSCEQKAEAERLLAGLVTEMGLADVHRRVLAGLPAERLADVADEEKAQLIVVGSRGRGAFRAAFLGSVSNSLVGVARCPVVIVPRGADAFAYASAA